MAMTTMHKVEPFVDSTPLLDDPERLRERSHDEGYLFFKKLIDVDAVLNVRRQILEVCRKHSWIDEEAALMNGVAKPGVSAAESTRAPRWQSFYCDVLKLQDFHALARHPSLVKMFETLFGEQVLPHSRNICRVMFPQTSLYSTPPHQDKFYIGGTEETWTAWIPCGDCPVELGSLAVALGSYKWGLLEVHKVQGAGGYGVDVPEDTTWMGGNIMCGDVLILKSLMVHQGRDNQTENLLRISCDFRYQPMSHPVREDSLLPHMRWLTWDEIYEKWPADDALKYYWNDWDLKQGNRI